MSASRYFPTFRLPSIDPNSGRALQIRKGRPKTLPSESTEEPPQKRRKHKHRRTSKKPAKVPQKMPDHDTTKGVPAPTQLPPMIHAIALPKYPWIHQLVGVTSDTPLNLYSWQSNGFHRVEEHAVCSMLFRTIHRKMQSAWVNFHLVEDPALMQRPVEMEALVYKCTQDTVSGAAIFASAMMVELEKTRDAEKERLQVPVCYVVHASLFQ